MKRVEHSAYLLVKAYTDSEWDNCDFAVIHISTEWKQCMRERLAKAQSFKDDKGFYYLTYSGSPENFYEDGDILSADDILAGDEDSCFIELEEISLDSLPLPESRLHIYQMVIDSDGLMKYKAFGKHTGEEYYTAEFSLTGILRGAE